MAALPDWAALTVAALVLLGASLGLTGSIGLLRLKNFYSRMHATTLGTTLGLFSMVVATVLGFSLGQGRPALGALVLGVLLTLTTPISTLLLVRAARQREQIPDMDEPPPGPGGKPD